VASQVTLSGSSSTPYGTAVTYTATVTEGATGSVSLDGLPGAISAPVVDGVATLTVPATLAAGAYTLRATYGGDDHHEASASDAVALTVTKLAGKVAITAPTTATYGTAVKVTIAVTDSRGTPAPGRVTLSGAGSSVTVTVPSTGKAVITLPKALAVKSYYTLKATYAGSTNVAGASATARLTVTRGTVSKVGVKVDVVPTSTTTGKATVTVSTASGLATPTGKVTVTVQRGSVKKSVAAWLRYGKVTLTLPKLTRGTWVATVSYAGSATYAPATAKASFFVTK
jgi:hypothetical protein